ncbi:MAG TPA: N-acetyltransferase [Pirellulaceae bacterium]|nr:N-acetyltransferase [Pirellulaceae bacterium]
MTYFRRYRMERALITELFPFPELPPGYDCHAWDPRDIDAHAHAKFLSFRAELDVHVFPCLGIEQGCLHLMKEIVGRNGFAPQATWLLTFQSQASTGHGSSVQARQPIGTIQGIVTDERTGTIQNIGIAPEHRGRGLGRLLIGRTLQGFQSLGLTRAVLEVTAHNTQACRLYERLGFRFQRIVYKFQDIASPY